MENKQNNHKWISESEWTREIDWELEHEQSLPRYTLRQLFEIFPEARPALMRKKAEIDSIIRQLESAICIVLREIKKHPEKPERINQFYEQLTEWLFGKDLEKFHSEAQQIKRLLNPIPQKKNCRWLNREEIMNHPRYSLLDLASTETQLKPIPNNRWKGLCPFHKEKTPSFYVFIDSKGYQFFHCFGCGAHGDVISFVMKTRNISFFEALQFLS